MPVLPRSGSALVTIWFARSSRLKPLAALPRWSQLSSASRIDSSSGTDGAKLCFGCDGHCG
jgi:hypothetical protein